MFQQHRTHTRRLPLELCESIVGFVGYGQMTDLCSCALVCRDWLQKSRKQILGRVVMFTKPQANKFISTITASPHLGAYVRELELRLGGQHQDWIYTVTRDLPSPLVNLDHLVYEEIPVLHPLFFNFSPRFDTVASLTLKYMKAWSFRDIVRLLNGCSNLEKLTVHRCEWRSPSPFYYRAPKWTEYMRPIPSSFHLDCPGLDGAYASDFLRWLVRRHETDPLHEFLFQCDRLPIRSRHLHDLVHQSSRTLTSLELRFDPVDEDSDHEAPEHDKSCKCRMSLLLCETADVFF